MSAVISKLLLFFSFTHTHTHTHTHARTHTHACTHTHTHTHTHTLTNSGFSSRILFFIASALLQDFLPTLNPRREDLFLILRNTRFLNQFYMLIVTSLKSTTR